ncbi:MAG: carbohydrate-binding domain-containing protein, partial [Lachnospiraceae bacterium]|nr:carbohydrate-binding domain-containing protein [Lachnospiraceae bacterium]
STNDVDATLGNIIIDGGELILTGDSDDIQAENMVTINGGTLHLSAGKSGIQSVNGTEYNGGIVSSLQ